MATMTITTTGPQASRVAAAVGKKYGYRDSNGAPRDATAQEIKDDCIAYLRVLVFAAEQAPPAPPAAFDPT